MKTMKFLARRVSALVLVATVGLTALVPAAFAAPASLPDLPKDQCVVDDANVLSSSPAPMLARTTTSRSPTTTASWMRTSRKSKR